MPSPNVAVALAPALLCLVTGVAAPGSAAAAPRLRCQLDQGGETQTVEFAPVRDQAVSIAFVGDVMLDTLPGRAIRRGPRSVRVVREDPRRGRHPRRQSRMRRRDHGHARAGQALHVPRASAHAGRARAPLRRRLAREQSLGRFRNRSAFDEMLGLLERRGIAYFGGGRDLARAHEPLIVERKGCASRCSATTSSCRAASRPITTGPASRGARTIRCGSTSRGRGRCIAPTS
jgi:hypothetical protein